MTLRGNDARPSDGSSSSGGGADACEQLHVLPMCILDTSEEPATNERRMREKQSVPPAIASSAAPAAIEQQQLVEAPAVTTQVPSSDNDS